MIYLVLLFFITTIISITGLYFSVKRNLEMIEIIEETMSEVEESLEILDYCYNNIDKKAKLELFSDDPTIRELVDDIKQARKAVLFVSERLTGEKENVEGKNLA